MGGYESWRQLVVGQTPASATDFTYRVPGETYARLEIIRFKLAASAVAGSRFPGLQFLDGDGNDFADIYSLSGIAANATVDLTLSTSVATDNYPTAGFGHGSIPDILMRPGFSWKLDNLGAQAGDQFSHIYLFICFYPSGDWADSPGSVPYSPPGIEIIA